MGGKLGDSGSVRASTEPDVHGRADLQYIAAIQCPRRFDSGNLVAECLDGLVDRCSFGLAARRAGKRDHGKFAVHHDGVFDEHCIGAIVGGGNFDGLPAVPMQGIHVAVPLQYRQIDIDLGPLEMCQHSLGQSFARSPDERPHAGRCVARNAMVLAHAALAAPSL